MSDDPAAAVRTLRVPCEALSLEAELAEPAESLGAVVLAHPHPVQGGSMRSLVTSELFRQLPAHGLAALRFNFRGVEGSEGEHGGGMAERADVLAAIEAMAALVDARPLVLAGWSFGADVSLAVSDDRLAGWFAIAPPLRVLPAELFVARSDPRPKLLAVPEHDAFRAPDAAREATGSWRNTRIVPVAGADHFFVGRTQQLGDLLLAFVDELKTEAG